MTPETMKMTSEVWGNYCKTCIYTLDKNLDHEDHSEVCHQCEYSLGKDIPTKFKSR